MNGEILLLFVILLLALVLCSFLGGSNCSAKTEGFTSQNINGTYSGPYGANAVVTDTSIVFTNNGTVVTLTKDTSGTSYTGPGGYTATFNSNGQLTITDGNGNTTTTTTSTPSSSSSSSSDSDSESDQEALQSFPRFRWGNQGRNDPRTYVNPFLRNTPILTENFPRRPRGLGQ